MPTAVTYVTVKSNKTRGNITTHHVLYGVRLYTALALRAKTVSTSNCCSRARRECWCYKQLLKKYEAKQAHVYHIYKKGAFHGNIYTFTSTSTLGTKSVCSRLEVYLHCLGGSAVLFATRTARASILGTIPVPSITLFVALTCVLVLSEARAMYTG